jgi:hypothetical protein
VSARLEEFLSIESEIALDQVLTDVVTRAAQRVLEVSIYPAPAPEPMTVAPTTPVPVAAAPHKTGKLVRLKIDREHVEHLAGEMCPGCGTQRLVRAIVLWPGGKRPMGGADVAWWCKWCRQYYVEA